MRILTLLIFSFFLSTVTQAKEILTVYTFSSFISKYGPATKLKELFEKTCQCEIKFVSFDTIPTLLHRLRLEGKRSKADVILGIDSLILEDARKTELFISPTLSSTPQISPLFVSYGSNCLALVYNKKKITNPPRNLTEFIESPYLLMLQDPRTSQPGMGFLIWIKMLYGQKAPDIWKKLKPKIVTYTKGWAEAYALFLKGESDFVVGYMIDPLYHELAENNPNYDCILLTEKAFCIKHFAAKLRSSSHPKLADKFINFLLSEKVQETIAIYGWSYPVGKVPQAWEKAKKYKKSSKEIKYSPQDISQHRSIWIDEWLNSAS